MAESISEGTLRSWSKQVGDSVEADEEVATIETDKIDVSVNAPKSGKIVELLAKEDDTVNVGQDLFRIEPGEGGGRSHVFYLTHHFFTWFQHLPPPKNRRR
jgi:2-oxoglutarate dehydrogenase E2 component (dihydrolipoamide succinyltransferase)